MSKRRVVITGMGVVSPIGSTVERFWEALAAGASGVKRIQGFNTEGFDVTFAAEIDDFDAGDYLPKKEARRLDRYSHFALAASRMAMDQAGIADDAPGLDRERMGAVVGTGVGGLWTIEDQYYVLTQKGPGRCSPFMIPMMIPNIASGVVAMQHNLRGPNFAVTSACATAAHAIGDAMHMIQRDECDLVVAGGAESPITPLGIAGFAAMRALSTRNDDFATASRPFDRERDGFVMGEGAGIFVLEELEYARARGAEIYAEVAGFGMTCDAHHITAPVESGEGATRAMKMAMTGARLAPEQIDYINAHGTSTPLNDKIETRAVKNALGVDNARRVMMSSTKSMTGHLLGAAAGVETAACIMALYKGIVPPTINHRNPDPECDLDIVPNEAREAKVHACLNNSLGFGGHNACLCLKRFA